MMGRRTMLGAVGALALSGWRGAAAAPTADLAGISRVWGGLALVDSTGRTFQISDVGPPLTLIKLWAHWCPNCFAEIASLTSMVAAVGERSLKVILVSHPEYWARDQLAAKKHGFPFRLATTSEVNAPSTIREALLDPDGSYVVPRALLFKGADGSLVWKRKGSTDWISATSEIKAASVQ